MLAPGTVLDRYRIARRVGAGAMGAVYEAYHTLVGRRVAVKVLLPQFARNEQSLARFERESRASAAIGHDHIVDVFDCGVHDGVPYIVLEYLDGETLADRIGRTGPIPVSEACTIAKQMLWALGAAHAVGIVHRDVKPENVFLLRRSDRVVTKLLDFGISKFAEDMAHDVASVSRHVTAAGTLLGTLQYMSPEQAAGDADVDHRSDLYAVGVLLYEMLTGKAPFDAPRNEDLIYEIVCQPNGIKPLQSHNADIPAELDAVAVRGLSRRRDDRFQTAAEFLAALEPWGDSVPMPPPPTKMQSDPGGIRDAGVDGRVSNPTPLAWARSPDVSGRGFARISSETIPAPPITSVTTLSDRVPTSVAAPPSRARTIGVVATAALLAGLTVAAAVAGRRGRGASSASAAASTSQRASATVALDLEGVPDGAEVLIDGTPHAGGHIAFPRGTTHRVRVTASGHDPFEATVVADRDRTLGVALPRIAAPATPPATTTLTAAPSAPPVVPNPPVANPTEGRHHRRDPAAGGTAPSPAVPAAGGASPTPATPTTTAPHSSVPIPLTNEY